MNIILAIVVIYFSYKAWPYALAYFEKEHVRNDLVPKEYSPEEWNSEYLESKVEEANGLTLIPCGTYFTSPRSSIVKGPMLLFRTHCGKAIVTLVSARFLGAELKKVEIKTRFVDGTAMISSDQATLPDITSGTEKETLYEASLSDLLSVHMQKLQAVDKDVDAIDNSSAFSIYEKIEVNRAERMISQGYGYWSNPTQSTIRRTFRGVRMTVKMNRQNAKRIIETELRKRNTKA